MPTVIAFERGDALTRIDSILTLGLAKNKWLEFRALNLNILKINCEV